MTFACLENGDLPVQNGFHRGEAGDSGVDLAAQDIPDVVANAPVSNGRSSANSNTSSNNASREEHETIKRWREEHAKLLKQKDDAEIKQKKAMHEAATEELKAWKQKRKTEIEARKKKNREIEKQLQKEVKAEPKSDSWSEVAHLIDSVSLKTSPKNAPDTSRMKSLILERKAVA